MSKKLLDSDGLSRLWAKIKSTFIPASQKNAASGVCPLDSSGYVPSANLDHTFKVLAQKKGILTPTYSVYGQLSVIFSSSSKLALTDVRAGMCIVIIQYGSGNLQIATVTNDGNAITLKDPATNKAVAWLTSKSIHFIRFTSATEAILFDNRFSV